LLRRRPQVALIDDLAHDNPPGSRNAKRYQDVQELCAAGIHVISTMNIQHLESLYDAVERLTGTRVRDRVPDLVLDQSDEVVNVDLAPADLIQRQQAGQAHGFQDARLEAPPSGPLQQLRELALRELASRLDHRRRGETDGSGPSQDQLLVALGPRQETHAALLRHASRMAGRLNRNWYAVNVQAPGQSGAIGGPGPLEASRDLANQLGSIVFTLKGQAVAEALIDFAARYRVGTLVVGRPRRRRWSDWPRRPRVVERLLAQPGLAVLVVDGDPVAAPPPGPGGPHGGPRLRELLSPGRVLILPDAQDLDDLILALAHRALAGTGLDPLRAARSVMQREAAGSTFLNNGLGLPHAIVAGLPAPRVALGLPRGGVRGLGPVEAVFLLLTPDDAQATHLELMSVVSRAFQDAAVRSALKAAVTAEQVRAALALQEGD
jgi:two-component system sensor histidine kinase KdpD